MTISVATTKTGFDNTTDPVASAGMMTYAGSVDNLINNILNGNQAFDKQLFTASATMQIDGVSTQAIGVPTQALINVTPPGVASSGFLKTIGVSNNRFVILKATSGKAIVIDARGTGNITSVDGGYLSLSGNAMALLFCHNSQWALIGSTNISSNGLTPFNNFAATTDPTPADDVGDAYGVGSKWVNVSADRAWINIDSTSTLAIWKQITPPKNRWGVRAANAAAVGVGIAAPTVANSPANANDASNTFITLPTTAAAGNIAGWITTSFNLIRPAHDPIVEVIIKTSSDLTSQRDWIGLVDADITNVDTLAAGREFIGFRYSSVAVDPGWMPVLHDGTTQNVGTAMGGAIQASTVYKLRFRVVSALSTVYFSVNDSAEQAMTTNFPAAATDMGAICRCIAVAASIRNYAFASFDAAWG